MHFIRFLEWVKHSFLKLSDMADIPPQVMTRQVGEETVILNLESGVYFGLDQGLIILA